MKRLAFLFNFIITYGFLACNDVTKPNLSQIKNEQKFDGNTIKATNKMHSGITEAEKFDCKSLKDKKVILEFANSIIAKKDNKNIWNISEIDTNEFFTCEDYFTNSKKKNRLVLIGGNAGLSAGSEDNLLILFSCIDSLNILWSGQVGEFDLSDIKDLNGDGIKDIICESSMVWMGECNYHFDIFNFKNAKQNFIFESQSTSVLDCGWDNIPQIYKRGDTIEIDNECSLIKLNNGEFNVRQIRTIKIHNGGQTEKEFLRNLKVIVDTNTIYLK